MAIFCHNGYVKSLQAEGGLNRPFHLTIEVLFNVGTLQTSSTNQHLLSTSWDCASNCY